MCHDARRPQRADTALVADRGAARHGAWRPRPRRTAARRARGGGYWSFLSRDGWRDRGSAATHVSSSRSRCRPASSESAPPEPQGRADCRFPRDDGQNELNDHNAHTTPPRTYLVRRDDERVEKRGERHLLPAARVPVMRREDVPRGRRRPRENDSNMVCRMASRSHAARFGGGGRGIRGSEPWRRVRGWRVWGGGRIRGSPSRGACARATVPPFFPRQNTQRKVAARVRAPAAEPERRVDRRELLPARVPVLLDAVERLALGEERDAERRHAACIEMMTRGARQSRAAEEPRPHTQVTVQQLRGAGRR